MKFEIHLSVKNVVVEKTLNELWNLCELEDLETLIERDGKYSIENFFQDLFFYITIFFEKTNVGATLKFWFNQCIIVNEVNKINPFLKDVCLLRIGQAEGMRCVDKEILRDFVLVAFDHLGPPNLECWKEKCLDSFNELIIKTPFVIAIKRLLKSRIRSIVYLKYPHVNF
jgi:hypothetical protein